MPRDLFADNPPTGEETSAPAGGGGRDLFADSPPEIVPEPTPAPDPAKVIKDVSRRAALAQELVDRGESVSLKEFFEPLLAIGSSIVAEPVAGVAGIAGSVLPGEEGQGLNWLEQTREAMTYTPETDKAKQTLGELGELMAPAGEAFTGLEQTLGDFAFDLTGSPALAATAASVPTAALELLGLTSLRNVRRGTRLLDDAGRPTKVLRKELNRAELDFDSLTPAVRDNLPAVADPKLLPGGRPVRDEVRKALAAEIEAGSTADALAGLKLDEYGNLVADAAGNRATRQGFKPGFVQAVKVSSPETKSKMQEMVKKMKQIKRNERKALDTRPTDVVGDAVMERIKLVRDKVKQANKQLDDIAETELAGQQIDTYRVQDTFVDALDKLDVKLSDDLKPDFKGSDIKLDRAAQRAVKDIIDVLSEGDSVDALRAHKVKRQLDKLIDYRKASSTKLTPTAQRILKKVRRSLNESIREVNPEYAKLNDILSAGVNALDEFNDSIGKRMDIYDRGSEKAIGQEMRKLMSNYAKRNELDNTLQTLDHVAQQFGGNFNDDVRTLAMFANGLEERFGSVAKTSFAGQIEKAVGNAAQVAAYSPEAGVKTAVIQGIGGAAKKLRGINEFNAFEALEGLLK